jgi:hypothetical protein
MSCLPPCCCSTCALMASAKTVSPLTRSCVFFAMPYAAASWSTPPPPLVVFSHLSDFPQVGYPPILLNNPDRLFVVLKESALSMLLIVLSSLQADMLPSTWSGCISRMHEIFPVPQPLRFMPEHLSQFVQLSETGVQIDRNSRGERILLPLGVSAWECIDPNDPSDPYSEQVRSRRRTLCCCSEINCLTSARFENTSLMFHAGLGCS